MGPSAMFQSTGRGAIGAWHQVKTIERSHKYGITPTALGDSPIPAAISSPLHFDQEIGLANGSGAAEREPAATNRLPATMRRARRSELWQRWQAPET